MSAGHEDVVQLASPANSFKSLEVLPLEGYGGVPKRGGGGSGKRGTERFGSWWGATLDPGNREQGAGSRGGEPDLSHTLKPLPRGL